MLYKSGHVAFIAVGRGVAMAITDVEPTVRTRPLFSSAVVRHALAPRNTRPGVPDCSLANLAYVYAGKYM